MKTFNFLLILFFLGCLFSINTSGADLVINGNRIMDQSMEENLCALTFDDGPSINTSQLLDTLEKNGIKATFFVLGSHVAKNPELVQRISKEGHEVGNHSWSHPNLRILSEERQREEIENTDKILRSQGIVPLYMRPPYGNYDEKTLRIAEELGISLVLWSLDSNDWRHLPLDYSKLQSTRGTVYENGKLRGIFLFHDSHKTTVDDAQRMIDHLRAGGCEKFVTVNEFMQASKSAEQPLAMRRNDYFPSMEPVYLHPADNSSNPLARCGKTSPVLMKSAKSENVKTEAKTTGPAASHMQMSEVSAGLQQIPN